MVAGSISPIGCALRNTLKISTKYVQKGLLIKGSLEILLNVGVFDMYVLELTICVVDGSR